MQKHVNDNRTFVSCPRLVGYSFSTRGHNSPTEFSTDFPLTFFAAKEKVANAHFCSADSAIPGMEAFSMHPRIDPWCVLRVRPRFERLVRTHLQANGFEVLLPSRTIRRQLSTQIKTIELPLFPGFLLCRVPASARQEVELTPGVLCIVESRSRRDSILAEAEITSLQTVLRSPLPYQAGPLVDAAHPIQVLNGPLADLTALLVESRTRRRVAVNVGLLRQSVLIDLPGETDVASILDRPRPVRVPA